MSNSKPIGIYIHVPFCKRKCPYCDFYSVSEKTQGSDIKEKYVNALCEDMKSYIGKGIVANTLYFGGGTPSLLTIEQVDKVIKTCKEVFSLEGEISMENNPCAVDFNYLCQIRKAGVNRISFGVQSLCQKELEALGRLHDKQTAINAITMAKRAGFNDISADIMLGTPYQTEESLKKTIEELTELPITHVSAYMLKIEENTPYAKSDIKDFCAEDETLADMYLSVVNQLASKGLIQYEISNFSKVGQESKHNLKYWHCEEYLSFGAAAHSYFRGKRYLYKPDIHAYIDNPSNIKIITDNAPGGIEEKIMLGLRLSEGVLLSTVKNAEGFDYNEFIRLAELLQKSGHLIIDEEKIALTPTGFLASNAVIGRLINF